MAMKKGPKMRKYRVHTAEFKRQIMAEFEAGRSQLQLAKEHGISPGLIAKWRHKMESGEGFSDVPSAREKELEKQLELTERKLAQMVIENDLLKKLQKVISQRMKKPVGLLSTGKKLAPKEEPRK